MKLDVGNALRSPGKSFSFIHREVVPTQLILGEQISFPDPVMIAGSYQMLEDVLYLKATMTAVAQAQCAKCLAPVRFPLKVEVEEPIKRLENSRAERSEIEDWTEEQFTFSGNSVEMSHLTLTLLLLELPMRFLCEEGCASVPEAAEVDFIPNASQKDLPDQHPFAALQQLLKKDQEV